MKMVPKLNRLPLVGSSLLEVYKHRPNDASGSGISNDKTPLVVLALQQNLQNEYTYCQILDRILGHFTIQSISQSGWVFPPPLPVPK